jgi:hypothetical protein
MMLFHLLILLGVIPFTIVWGGRITSRQQMLRMETISILVNLVLLTLVALRAGFFGPRVHPKIITTALWIMTGWFVLNTLGNLLSQNGLEQMIFTPLTLVLSVLCFRLAIHKDPRPTVHKEAEPGTHHSKNWRKFRKTKQN